MADPAETLNWDGKPGRCEMYCANLSDEDWLSICDCWEAERRLEPPARPRGEGEET